MGNLCRHSRLVRAVERPFVCWSHPGRVFRHRGARLATSHDAIRNACDQPGPICHGRPTLSACSGRLLFGLFQVFRAETQLPPVSYVERLFLVTAICDSRGGPSSAELVKRRSDHLT